MPASSLKREQPSGKTAFYYIPFWPLARSSPSAFFELANAIAEPGRVFVRLSRDRLLQLLAQLNQLRLGLFILRQTARCLAAVADLAMDVLQQRTQFFAKLLIVVWTTQPARITKFHKLDAADGAFPLIQGTG